MARTNRRDDVDQQKHKAKKTARTLIRLKMSLIADDILNDIVPAIDEAVDKALSEGESWEFDVLSLIKDVEGQVNAALPETINV